jgi:hypothetical protein
VILDEHARLAASYCDNMDGSIGLSVRQCKVFEMRRNTTILVSAAPRRLRYGRH